MSLKGDCEEEDEESKNATASACQSVAMSVKIDSARLPSGLFLESERSQTVLSMVSAYDAEMNLYLASLPLEVRDEDLLNVQAERLAVCERPAKKRVALTKGGRANERAGGVEASAEERYAKNLHLFCMVEHERRGVLLLPDELVNVTRKLHTKNRFDNVRECFFMGRLMAWVSLSLGFGSRVWAHIRT